MDRFVILFTIQSTVGVGDEDSLIQRPSYTQQRLGYLSAARKDHPDGEKWGDFIG